MEPLLASITSASAICKLSQRKYPVLNITVTVSKLKFTVLPFTRIVHQPLFQERKGYSYYAKSPKRSPFHYSVHASIKTICAVVALLLHQQVSINRLQYELNSTDLVSDV